MSFFLSSSFYIQKSSSDIIKMFLINEIGRFFDH